MRLADRLGAPTTPPPTTPAHPAPQAPPPPPAAGTVGPPPASPLPTAPARTAPPRAAKAALTAPVARGGDEWLDKKRTIQDHIVGQLGPRLSAGGADLDLAEEVRGLLDEAIAALGVTTTSAQRKRLFGEVTADILGYGPIEPLLTDPTVSEVMVNGPNEIFVERDGKITLTDTRFNNEKHLRQVIDRIVSGVGRRVDESSPMCDARLPDGSRVNVILPPLSIKGPVMTIRKFPEQPLLMADLVQIGSMSQATADFLRACVEGKLNILVSGGTGTGKTTVLNAVSQFIPARERIVSIEDAAELQLNQPHIIPLEARPANAEGSGLVTIRDLVRNSLRMRPDRIIVGEVRGPEALDMLQAMNTGHEGSLTTVHANSPRDALSRLETMILMSGIELGLRAVREQIGSALDLMVHLDRLGDGRRVISAIEEIQGLEGDVITTQTIFGYHFEEGGRETSRSSGYLRPTGFRPKVLDKLIRAGVHIDRSLFAELPGTGGGRS
ncbi:MAG: CpaF family protein [Euzebya sp.]